MFRKRAVIFALDTIIDASHDERGYRWTFDPRLPGLLRDCKATGRRIFGLLDPSSFGLALETDAERQELAAYLSQKLVDAGAPPLDAIHITDDIADPTIIWMWKRRFSLSLRASTLIGTGVAYTQLRNNAGIGGDVWAPRSSDEIFGPNPILGV